MQMLMFTTVCFACLKYYLSSHICSQYIGLCWGELQSRKKTQKKDLISIFNNWLCMATIIWGILCGNSMSHSLNFLCPHNPEALLRVTQNTFAAGYFTEQQRQADPSFHHHTPQKMAVVSTTRASVCSRPVVRVCNLTLCGPTAAWAFLIWRKLDYHFLFDHNTSG